MAWQIEDNRPVYVQLVEQIQQKIISGEYLAGERLPSVRELAREAGVNPNTMQRAFQDLERKGLVYSNRTSGRFITDNQQILKNASNFQAMQLVKSFYEHMRSLGYTKEEMISLLNKYEEDKIKDSKGE